MRITVFICSIILMLGSLPCLSQCECEEEKKYFKLLEQASDKKKYDLRKRIQFLENAQEIDEDCPDAIMMLGELYFKRAKSSPNISYRSAQGYFEDLSSRCPEYHSDIITTWVLSIILRRIGLQHWQASSNSSISLILLVKKWSVIPRRK
ncbi:MAG: hypothetical protein HKO93_03540 [Flavobacteriales bacterium]|nr:hypothetical protein [Flavobacteriales bacterium]